MLPFDRPVEGCPTISYYYLCLGPRSGHCYKSLLTHFTIRPPADSGHWKRRAYSVRPETARLEEIWAEGAIISLGSRRLLTQILVCLLPSFSRLRPLVKFSSIWRALRCSLSGAALTELPQVRMSVQREPLKVSPRVLSAVRHPWLVCR